MLFFVGLHQPSDAKHFERSFISVNRLRARKSNFDVADWIMDSGAFSEIATYGNYRVGVDEYVAQIERWRTVGNMRAAVTQDWMCEPWIVAKTGKTVREHQRLTLERYDAITAKTTAYVMPVLQGYEMGDYLRHLEDYGDRLTPGKWVGVGSICKRNTNVAEIEDILFSIKSIRPDLRLHGFGLKTTSLRSAAVNDMLYTADSMAWSYNARKQGRNSNDWREAKAFEERIKK
jgi:transcriptional regulator of met regulon